MKKLALFLAISLSLFGANENMYSGSIYNCVDCSYDSSMQYTSKQNNNKMQFPIIVYQEPEEIKVLIQNYSCPNCGLFEVSIRATTKKEMIKK